MWENYNPTFICPFLFNKTCDSLFQQKMSTDHTDLQKLSVILRRNLFPENLINKYISKYIQTVVKGGKTQPHSGVEPRETPKFYFKIPYIRHFSVTAQRSIRKLANQLCKPIDIRLAFYYFQNQEYF